MSDVTSTFARLRAKLPQSISVTPQPTDVPLEQSQDVTMQAKLASDIILTSDSSNDLGSAAPTGSDTSADTSPRVEEDAVVDVSQLSIDSSIVSDPDVLDAILPQQDEIPKEQIKELSEQSEAQLQRLMDDPVTNYLGVKPDAMNERRRKIFNDAAVKLSAASISQINDRIEELFTYLKDVEWEYQSTIMIKQDRVNSAKTKKDKERILREDLAWQDQKKSDDKADKKVKRAGIKNKAVAKSQVMTAQDLEIDRLPADIKNTVKSMIKAGITKEKALQFARDMKGGK